LGVAPPVAEVAATPVERLLGRYRSYLTGERGLGAETARGYVDLARPFVAGQATADGVDLEHLSAGDVVGFVLASCRDRAPRTTQLTVTALRSLLGFLHLDGVLATSLAAAVPSVANRRAGLPPAGGRGGQRRPDRAGRHAAAPPRHRPAGRGFDPDHRRAGAPTPRGGVARSGAGGVRGRRAGRSDRPVALVAVRSLMAPLG
jgi:integrase/recombinase XerD